MEIEQGNHFGGPTVQELYPRILPNQMSEYNGKMVTIIGSVCKDDRNGALVIEYGQGNIILVENKRKSDLDHNTRYVEVRGKVTGSSSMQFVEITELYHQSNDEFDFKTYFKMVELTFNDKLRHLFAAEE